MYIIGMLSAEETLSFIKQNLHASLIFFWSPEYIKKNTNSRATISPQNMNLLKHLGMFTFENYCPNNELGWDKHFRFCFILFLDFPPWLLPFEPLHTDYGYSSCYREGLENIVSVAISLFESLPSLYFHPTPTTSSFPLVWRQSVGM